MSKQGYEVGTVAAITVQSGALYGRALRTSDGGWRVPSLGDFYYDREVVDVRPLIVLDLDGAPLGTVAPGKWLRDFADLAQGRPDWVMRRHLLNTIVDQIEAQAKPPKPVEPTGLGAVVVDDRGEYYVGLGDHYGTGQLRWKGDRGMTFTSYDRINVVRVISEGVRP